MSSSSPRRSNLNAPEQQGRESHKASSPGSPGSRKAVAIDTRHNTRLNRVFKDPILSDLLRSTGWERIEDKLMEKRKYNLKWRIWLEAVGKAEVEEWEKALLWKESITMQQLRGEDQCEMASFLRRVWEACEIRGSEDDGNYVAAVYIQ
ncbi:hypothetical protein BDZ91DRAFT_783408 [Kalaharituber pfeilii]|nr:hypothetical protein BDZ91DRAFT_783408 [Kalaharituber pfeilii]